MTFIFIPHSELFYNLTDILFIKLYFGIFKNLIELLWIFEYEYRNFIRVISTLYEELPRIIVGFLKNSLEYVRKNI
jgi:hypothetical protein